MSKKVKKWFVVREGKKTGIFETRDECKGFVQGFSNAKYKSFLSLELAKEAFNGKYEDFIGEDNRALQSKFDGDNFFSKKKSDLQSSQDCIFVDAACSGNPGVLERRGVDFNGKEVFRQGPYQDGTVNVGEFLALVQGLGYLKKIGKNKNVVYSDSMTAMSWVKNKKANTKLKKTSKNSFLFDLINRAESFLNDNVFENEILKRDTTKRGEIPADFGRK